MDPLVFLALPFPMLFLVPQMHFSLPPDSCFVCLFVLFVFCPRAPAKLGAPPMGCQRTCVLVPLPGKVNLSLVRVTAKTKLQTRVSASFPSTKG